MEKRPSPPPAKRARIVFNFVAVPAVTVEMETNTNVLMHVSHGYKITNPCLNGMRLNGRTLPNAFLRPVSHIECLRTACTVELQRN